MTQYSSVARAFLSLVRHVLFVLCLCSVCVRVCVCGGCFLAKMELA